MALSRARAWLLWVGVFVLSTAALRAYRGGTDVVYAVLTYLLVVLGGSVSGGRPLGFALTAAGVGSIDFFFQLPRSEERRVGKECRSRWSPYH